MQKRAVRAMAGVRDDVSAREYFSQFQIMTLPCMHIEQIAMFTQVNLHLFERRGAVSAYGLRSNVHKDQLVAAPHKLAKSKRSVYQMGPQMYNRLPEGVRDAASIHTFKSKLKVWLLEQRFYSYEDFLENPLLL